MECTETTTTSTYTPGSAVSLPTARPNQRHSTPDPDWLPLAGRPRQVWALVAGLRIVFSPGSCPKHGCVLKNSSSRRPMSRAHSAGTWPLTPPLPGPMPMPPGHGVTHRSALMVNPLITRWAGPAVGFPPRFTWPATDTCNQYHLRSPQDKPGMPRS